MLFFPNIIPMQRAVIAKFDFTCTYAVTTNVIVANGVFETSLSVTWNREQLHYQLNASVTGPAIILAGPEILRVFYNCQFKNVLTNNIALFNKYNAFDWLLPQGPSGAFISQDGSGRLVEEGVCGECVVNPWSLNDCVVIEFWACDHAVGLWMCSECMMMCECMMGLWPVSECMTNARSVRERMVCAWWVFECMATVWVQVHVAHAW